VSGEPAAPPEGTVERWAFDFATACELAHKQAPPPVPASFEVEAPERRLAAPGRPPELRVVPKAPRSLRRGELRSARRRAQLLHAFWHHELQAAELMCWAVLAFPRSEPEFRRGLVAICRDEVRHMAMYARCLAELGACIGDFPVRDWFWSRVPRCRTPVEFTALLGLGLEGSNLDHAERFAGWFDEVGDARAADVQRTVGRDEVEHVRFAAHWFARWTGGLEFATWARALSPLTPALFQGRPLNRAARLAAGLPPEFVDALAQWDRAGP
jgi:uncharacterized ferritin-like protein (DUF455 family)